MMVCTACKWTAHSVNVAVALINRENVTSVFAKTFERLTLLRHSDHIFFPFSQIPNQSNRTRSEKQSKISVCNSRGVYSERTMGTKQAYKREIGMGGPRISGKRLD